MRFSDSNQNQVSLCDTEIFCNFTGSKYEASKLNCTKFWFFFETSSIFLFPFGSASSNRCSIETVKRKVNLLQKGKDILLIVKSHVSLIVVS